MLFQEPLHPRCLEERADAGQVASRVRHPITAAGEGGGVDGGGVDGGGAAVPGLAVVGGIAPGLATGKGGGAGAGAV